MSTPAPAVSIVVVSWNGRELLRRCLELALAVQLQDGVEVIVVDNGSTDGAPEMVAEEFPAVTLLQPGTNLGFAAGNNHGFATARGRFVLLLNPDCFLDRPETLPALLAFLDAHPTHGGVGCRLNYPDGSHQVGDAGHAPTPLSVLAHGFGAHRLMGGAHGLFLPEIRGSAPVEVDWICGALFLVRREVINHVGGLDPGFFMYAEDVEWGCRIRAAGWRIAYLPWLSATHVQGGTQAGGASASTRWLDAMAVLYRRRHPRGFWAFRLGLGLGFGLRAGVYGVLSLLPGRQAGGRQGRRNKARAMARFSRHALLMRRA